MGRTARSQAERDAATVEIGYALASAGFLAAVAFGVIAGPALVWRLPAGIGEALLVAGALAAGALAAVRVVHVLRGDAGRRPARRRTAGGGFPPAGGGDA